MGKYDIPGHIQLDTSDECNLRCEYCYMHYASPSLANKMPLHLVEHIMSQTKELKLQTIRPYLWGDSLLETRLPKIVEIIRKYNSAPIVSYTNGTTYENRRLLLCPDEAHFTVSAVTPKTYEKIHGLPLLHEAEKTIQWLEQQRNHPRIVMHFVINRHNIHELEQWIERWRCFEQFLSPILMNKKDKHLADQLTDYDPSIKLSIVTGGMHGMPCSVWNNCSINVHGFMLQCCNGAYDVNYGDLSKVPLLDAWKKRIENRMMNPACQGCHLQAQNWKDMLD